MAVHKPRFIVDDRGEETAVILDIVEYKKLLQEGEELEAIRAHFPAKQCQGIKVLSPSGFLVFYRSQQKPKST